MSVTDWHRYILQTLSNHMGLQTNGLDGKGSSTVSSKLINHYSERFSLTSRVSVALVFVVLNSVSSILGFFFFFFKFRSAGNEANISFYLPACCSTKQRVRINVTVP